MQLRRVAILGQFLESNRYSPVVTRNRFRRLHGDEICEDVRSATPKLVTAREDAVAADKLCVSLANRAWGMRERFLWRLTPVDEAVETAVHAGQHPSDRPVLLADLGDNIGAGGPGNTLWMLEALINAGACGVLIGSFFDPGLVQQAAEAGVGSRIQAIFHGDDWEREISQLVLDDVRVLRLHSGQFRITSGPLTDMPVSAGPSCLLKVGEVLVLVTSRRPIVWPDPSLLVELKVDIQTVRTLVLKCRSNYRAVFNQYFDSDRMIEVDTPGRTSPVLTRHNWLRIPRPFYPIDRDFQWSASAAPE